MRIRYMSLISTISLSLFASTAFGHFHIFWPEGTNGYAKLGQAVTWHYAWGHPYEMILFDTQPATCYVATPDGEKQPLTLTPTQMEDPDTGQPRKTFTFTYTPQTLGDSWLVLEGPPYLVEEEEGYAVKDYAKQCIHVMAERGWYEVLGLPIELVPLTRPYGLEAGSAFTVRAYLNSEPLSHAFVEIEKFNGFYVSEDKLPKDTWGMEDVPMVTKAARTDVNGYATYTLDEPGWWILAVTAESGKVTVDGEEYPCVLRGCLWVYVAEPFTPQP